MKSTVGFGLIGVARLLEARHQWADAVMLHRAAEAILNETGLTRLGTDRQLSEQLLDDSEVALGDDAFQDASIGGQQLDDVAASAIAIELLDAYTSTATTRWTSVAGRR